MVIVLSLCAVAQIEQLKMQTPADDRVTDGESDLEGLRDTISKLTSEVKVKGEEVVALEGENFVDLVHQGRVIDD